MTKIFKIEIPYVTIAFNNGFAICWGEFYFNRIPSKTEFYNLFDSENQDGVNIRQSIESAEGWFDDEKGLIEINHPVLGNVEMFYSEIPFHNI